MKHSVSGACASTTPHGSTIIERPCHWSFGVLAPRWSGAITNTWFSIARARSSGSQWSLPVGAVNADGSVTTFAPRSAWIRNSSGNRRS